MYSGMVLFGYFEAQQTVNCCLIVLLSVTVSFFDPPVNVGVAPTDAPEEDSIVTSCASGAGFEKSTVTLPAFAVNDLVLYSSWPSLLASRLTVLAPVGAAVVDVAELVVGAAAVAELVVGA